MWSQLSQRLRPFSLPLASTELRAEAPQTWNRLNVDIQTQAEPTMSRLRAEMGKRFAPKTKNPHDLKGMRVLLLH
jgi:hypothetical protein